MRLPSLKVLVITAIALGAVGLVAGRVLASTPTVKGKGKVFQVVNFRGEDSFNTNIVDIPEKQTMVLTDIIVSNQSGQTGEFAVRCVSELGQTVILGPIVVTDDSNFSHSFSCGLECPEATTMQVTLAAPQINGWTVSGTGYLRKGN
ncbi:MAG TPA: hypothetical protein VFY71_16190 [Planctomycetota bacterium]|nr:hypothetical protein [Planctomycetota bacterium]